MVTQIAFRFCGLAEKMRCLPGDISMARGNFHRRVNFSNRHTPVCHVAILTAGRQPFVSICFWPKLEHSTLDGFHATFLAYAFGLRCSNFKRGASNSSPVYASIGVPAPSSNGCSKSFQPRTPVLSETTLV